MTRTNGKGPRSQLLGGVGGGVEGLLRENHGFKANMEFKASLGKAGNSF